MLSTFPVEYEMGVLKKWKILPDFSYIHVLDAVNLYKHHLFGCTLAWKAQGPEFKL
jgi:hypothetical protein